MPLKKAGISIQIVKYAILAKCNALNIERSSIKLEHRIKMKLKTQYL